MTSSELPKSRAGGFGKLLADYAPIGLVAAAIWLGWRIAIVPLALRAPPELVLRVAPTSPIALRRAAEAELSEGRITNAHDLAELALRRSPFDVRALRTIGLAEARSGRASQADQILTLAGNWSLRDDPTHGWLIDRRLRQGDYASAFAHADTLARRREDQTRIIFRFFTVAASQDPRAVPHLVHLLATRPPWRPAYLFDLNSQSDEAALQVRLATSLQRTPAPLSRVELERLYETWLKQGRIPGLRFLRGALNRPPVSPLVVDGSFESEPGEVALPFAWSLQSAPGLVPAVDLGDGDGATKALRVEYDGYASGTAVRQLLLLKPGQYTLKGQWRLEAGDESRLAWSLQCFEGQTPIATFEPGSGAPNTQGWVALSQDVRVPEGNCSAQWLSLAARPGDRRSFSVTWFDDLEIQPAG